MTTPTTQSRPPITDSPWFWVYLFATAALALLMVSKPKLQYRQAWLERQHQAREFSHRLAEGQAVEGELIQPESTHIRIEYFFYLLAGVLIFAWGRLWYSRFAGAWFPRNSEQSVDSDPLGVSAAQNTLADDRQRRKRT